jgi:hypothetical protein
VRAVRGSVRFAAILDDQKGGSFRIASLYEAQHKTAFAAMNSQSCQRF